MQFKQPYLYSPFTGQCSAGQATKIKRLKCQAPYLRICQSHCQWGLSYIAA